MQQIEERVLNYTLGPKFNDSYFTVFFFIIEKSTADNFRCVKNGCEYDAKENEGVNR